METDVLKQNLERLIEKNKLELKKLNEIIPYTAYGLSIEQSEVGINETYRQILLLTSLALLKKGFDPFKELNEQIGYAFKHPDTIY